MMEELKCPTCSRKIDFDKPIYCLSLEFHILILGHYENFVKSTFGKKIIPPNPLKVIFAWEHEKWKQQESSLWSSEPYCSRECFDNDMYKIFADLKEFLANEELAKKLLTGT